MTMHAQRCKHTERSLAWISSAPPTNRPLTCSCGSLLRPSLPASIASRRWGSMDKSTWSGGAGNQWRAAWGGVGNRAGVAAAAAVLASGARHSGAWHMHYREHRHARQRPARPPGGGKLEFRVIVARPHLLIVHPLGVQQVLDAVDVRLGLHRRCARGGVEHDGGGHPRARGIAVGRATVGGWAAEAGKPVGPTIAMHGLSEAGSRSQAAWRCIASTGQTWTTDQKEAGAPRPPPAPVLQPARALRPCHASGACCKG